MGKLAKCKCCGETELGGWGFKCGCHLFLFCEAREGGCGKCRECCACADSKAHTPPASGDE